MSETSPTTFIMCCIAVGRVRALVMRKVGGGGEGGVWVFFLVESGRQGGLDQMECLSVGLVSSGSEQC